MVFLVQINFTGGSDAQRTHAIQVQDETLNPKPMSMGVVEYSDVHQDQQQEVSNFLMESFSRRVRQGYTGEQNIKACGVL
jgi:hypothetical protein